MKLIDKVITVEDYNYVEGVLELKLSGKKLSGSTINDAFSVDNVLEARFNITKKHIPPNVPEGIKHNKALNFKFNVPTKTFITENNEKLAFEVNFDAIICDDAFVNEDGSLKIERYNTIKEGNISFSTVTLKAYGLKKKKRKKTIQVEGYELFYSVYGKGSISVSPRKKYYESGDKITIRAQAFRWQHFLHWEGDLKSYYNKRTIELVVTDDIHFRAFFSQPKPRPKPEEQSPSFFDWFDFAFSDLSWLDFKTPKWLNFKLPKWFNFTLPNWLRFKWPAWLNFKLPALPSWLVNILSAFTQVIAYTFGGIFGIIFIIAFIKSIANNEDWAKILILSLSILGVPVVLEYLSRYKTTRKTVNFSSLITIVIALINLINIFNENSYVPPSPPTRVEIPETIEKENPNATTDYIHNITWKDYDGIKYSTTLSVNSAIVNHENTIKENRPLRNEYDYNNLLKTLYTESKTSLESVVKSLDSIKLKNNISYDKFPEVVVSMVQHIPYYAIMSKSCSPYDYKDESIRKLLQQSPCQGYIKHGIKTPAEFLKDLKADCDSRTLMLYSILKHFNYDVAIFSSTKYRHSLLGINIPIHNDNAIYKTVDNSCYYLWETTATEQKIGDIQPDMSNTNYWSLNTN